MSPRFTITEANEQYEMLKEYKAIREREISGMVAPYIRLTDRYGGLIAGLTLILGRIKPANTARACEQEPEIVANGVRWCAIVPVILRT